MKWHREWYIPVPWGELALVSRGHPDRERVLLVHGRQDSLSVFEPLIAQMSEHYYYVALDMPGNGLSDAFPKGPKLMRFHFLYAMEIALIHLGWDKFIFIGHSMGCEQGLFYNVIYPGQITKMILLDAGPTLMRMQFEDNQDYFSQFYDSYYQNYELENFLKKGVVKYKVRDSLQRLRNLSKAQAEHLLERNFHEIKVEKSELSNGNAPQILPENDNRPQDEEERSDGNSNEDKRRSLNTQSIQESDEIVGYLSWDRRLKTLAPQNYGNDYYFELFKSIPPTLLIAASDGAKNVPPNSKWRQGAKQLLEKMATLDNFHRVDVEGCHDVHYTHPERVLPFINAFLKDNKVSSKL